MAERYITYFRVSTDKQGRSGLGLKAQKKTVLDFINGNGSKIIGEYIEVESGKKDDRPELQKAIRDCRLKQARLIVSKLDRLSRDLHFITELQRSGVQFTIAEMPEATELTIHIYAAMAQHERKAIGQRTRDALRAAKASGNIKGQGFLGNPCLKRGERVPGSGDTTNARAARQEKTAAYAKEILEVVEEIRTLGATSLRQIAVALNEKGYKTYTGKEWNHGSVGRLLKREQAEK